MSEVAEADDVVIDALLSAAVAFEIANSRIIAITITFMKTISKLSGWKLFKVKQSILFNDYQLNRIHCR